MKNIIHNHTELNKPGLGEIVICNRLFRRCFIWFRPDFDAAGWHRVPVPGKNNDVLIDIIRAGTAENAMAVLRAHRDVA